MWVTVRETKALEASIDPISYLDPFFTTYYHVLSTNLGENRNVALFYHGVRGANGLEFFCG